MKRQRSRRFTSPTVVSQMKHRAKSASGAQAPRQAWPRQAARITGQVVHQGTVQVRQS